MTRPSLTTHANKENDLTLTPSLDQSAEAVELQKMLKEEQEVIKERKCEANRRHAANPAEIPVEESVVGLALSGGGIRSATFCFGILEVFERKGLMKHVDFLSTVSGGGYTGAAYSAWRLRQWLAENKTAQTPTGDAITVRENPPGRWEELLPHLRKFSNYLSPTLGIGSPGTWRILATMFRNLTIHWLALISAIVLVFAALLLVLRFLGIVSVVFAFVGLVFIACGLVQECAGKAYVRDCQNGGGKLGLGARLCQRLKRGFGITDVPVTAAGARCDVLKREVQNLLQSPRQSLFIGLFSYTLGAALGFAFSTYPGSFRK